MYAPSYPILGEKKAGLAGPAKETPEMLINPRTRLHRTTADRCFAREARQRMARQEAAHRSVTLGRAGVYRRPSPGGCVGPASAS
jgi:hypothetical protein